MSETIKKRPLAALASIAAPSVAWFALGIFGKWYIPPAMVAILLLVLLLGTIAGVLAFRRSAGKIGIVLNLAVLIVLVFAITDDTGPSANKQTLVTMALLQQAIAAYYDTCDAYPPDHDPVVYKGKTFWANPIPPERNERGELDANSTYLCGDGIRVLYMYLTGKHYVGIDANGNWIPDPAAPDLSAEPCVQKAQQYLGKLPNNAWSKTDHGFRDGYGTLMRYQLVNGKPVLTSAGSDTMFTFDPNKSGSYRDTDKADATGDNILSRP